MYLPFADDKAAPTRPAALPMRGAMPSAVEAELDTDAASREQRPLTPVEVSAIDGTRIMVVDDDSRNIFALSTLLERGHADVVTAESGAEAIAKLQELNDIDIVLMDIMMPVMDGYQTMAAIRELEGFKSIPIIAVTGKVVGGERQRCLDAGANEYVPKPVDTGELLAALRPLATSSRGTPDMMAEVRRHER